MKHFILFTIFVFLCGLTIASLRSSVIVHRSSNKLSTVNCQLSTEFNRPDFYKAMEENNKDLVIDQLTELKSAPGNIRDAFTGAMLMKKAGLGGSPVTKLHLFKEGHKMLEAAIKKDPDNAEFRFLRLMIQENAPVILGYKNELQKDSEFIRKSYRSLPKEVQHVMADYNKKSKFLKLEVS
ncbi:MAG TPA: hypothetical protein VII44_07920 [Puia sp.]